MTTSKILRAYIRESILPAAVHAHKRSKSKSTQLKPAKKQEIRPVSSNYRIKSKIQELTYDAIKLVGPYMAKKVFEQLKNISASELSQKFSSHYDQRIWTMKGPTRPQNIILNAKNAIASALIWASKLEIKGIKIIEKIIEDSIQKIPSDVNRAKQIK